jgi:uncharacterized RDD family membrane protein YckC
LGVNSKETAVTGDASSRRRPPTPWRIAPAPQRLVAGLIDATVLGLLGFSASRVLGRRFVQQHRGASVIVVALDAAYRVGLTTLAGGTLGQLAVRIRVIQQDSGAVPTWRQAALRWAVAAPAALGPDLVPKPKSARRWMLRAEQLQPRIDELQREHGHDRQRFQEELQALYEREGVDPAAACLARLPQAMAFLVYGGAVYLPVLRRPLRQGLHDRLAHTIVVRASHVREPGGAWP